MHRYSLQPKKTMDCGSNFVKYLLFIFNFIFWIFSIAILTLGVIYKLQVDSLTKYLGNDFPVAPDLFITVGVVAFVISFFGCFGAWKENRCALLTFVSLLIVLLLIEIGVVVIAFIVIQDKNLESDLKKEMSNELCRGELNSIQKSFECCGVLNFHDYEVPPGNPNNCPAQGIPESCYPGGDKQKEPFQVGCYDKLKNSLNTIGVNFGAIGITVALMQIIGAVSAIMLSGAIKNSRF